MGIPKAQPTPKAEVADDSELIAQIAQGNVAILRKLYDRYGGLSLSIALNMLNDRAEAEEVVQDVFTKLWRSADRFDAERCSPKGWICMITRRASIDRLRKRVRRPDRDESRRAKLEVVDFEHLSSIETADSAQFATVEECLSRIRPAYRECIRLAYLQGLEHTEIAAKLDLPMGTVKTFIRRGLEKLREVLKNENE